MAKGKGICKHCGTVLHCDIDPSSIQLFPSITKKPWKVRWSIRAYCPRCGFRPDSWMVDFPLTIEQLLKLVPEVQDATQETSTNQS